MRLVSVAHHVFSPTIGPATPWGRWRDRARVEVYGHTSATRRVALLDPLTWEEPDGRLIVVPAGFMSDGATIPRVAWWCMGGRLALDYIRPAFLHDLACLVRNEVFGTSGEAAHRFYRGLRADGMSHRRAHVCFLGVNYLGPQWP